MSTITRTELIDSFTSGSTVSYLKLTEETFRNLSDTVMIIEGPTAPTGPTAPGTANTIVVNGPTAYLCYADDTWMAITGVTSF